MSLRLLCLAAVMTAASLPPPAVAWAADTRIVAACSAVKPSPGQRFSGPVMQVIDGSRLCVALSPDPADWIEVAPAGLIRVSAGDDGRALLMATTFAKTVTCVAADPRDSSVAAVCTVDGVTLDQAMRAEKARPDWRSWR